MTQHSHSMLGRATRLWSKKRTRERPKIQSLWVYIQDAPFRALPLIAGMDESAHDWGNLLEDIDKLHWAQPLATISFTIGIALMTLSIIWGYKLLYLTWRQNCRA